MLLMNKGPKYMVSWTHTTTGCAIYACCFSADTENHTDSEIIAHIDHEQSLVLDSLQHLHQKLDGVAKHLGVITSGHKPLPSLISAHRGDDHDASADMEHDQQMDSLISQVEATLQHPFAQAPATADIASRSESSSIGAAVRKQLDSEGEQLAQKVNLPSSIGYIVTATIEEMFGVFQALCAAQLSVLTWVANVCCSVLTTVRLLVMLIPVCPNSHTEHTSSAYGVILDVQSRFMRAHMKGKLVGLPPRSAI